MQFRKKPVLIEATQLRASAFDNAHPNPEHIVGVIYDPVQRCAFIKTLEGTMRADIGDWIITGVMGEMYPCKPDIFAMTYEPVAPQAEPSSGYAEGHRAGYVLARTEPCIGNDPACPCQDGDPCHYRDHGGTKAMPQPERQPVSEPTEAQIEAWQLLADLVAGLEATHWSSWQTTAHFDSALDAARAALAAKECTGHE